MPKKRPAGKLAILDIETDPFLYGRVPAPFVVGLYYRVYQDDGSYIETYTTFWGDDCIHRTICFLASVPDRWLIYAHNGGKFDYMYFLHSIVGKLRIINGRIVSAELLRHEIRDSYAIMPFPLRDYKKDDIDYQLMERENRETHKQTIIEYLRGDCVYLYDLVHTFHKEFGTDKLTIGSTAMQEIQTRCPQERTTIAFDRQFRKQFFYGGRVECFKGGIIYGNASIYDVNSMYPDGMQNCLHPTGADYEVRHRVSDATCFIHAEGRSNGAFPVRSVDGLTFPKGNGLREFFVTRHEYNAGIHTGSFLPETIIKTFDFPNRCTFADFVSHFFDARAKVKMGGDFIRALLYKFVLNSSYGKFAQNPANFNDWTLATLANRPRERCKHCNGYGVCFKACWKCQALNNYEPVENCCSYCLKNERCCQYCYGTGQRWHLHEYNCNEPEGPMFWKARTFVQSYYNVATGASITGAARAKLLIGISQCDDPLYCDTDSVITLGEFHGDIGNSLGQWKHEGTGTVSAIAGKKLYAIFSNRPPELSSEDARKYPWMLEPVYHRNEKLWCIKKAHKGLKLEPADILHIAAGGEVESFNQAPTFGLFKEPTFIQRRARRTA